jgi:predicted N-acetyltransferase YhbS
MVQAPHHAVAAATLIAAQGWEGRTGDATAIAATLLRKRGPGVPCVFVAELDGRFAGTASLDPHDLPGREDLTPWLANVAVVPALRGRGIGGALVRTVEQAARDAGQATLWLYTSTARGLYLRLGWQDAFRTRVKDTTVDVMRRDLALAPLPPAA